MYDAAQFRDTLIIPMLEKMEAWGFAGANNPSAVNLLIGTAFHESLGGKYLHQVGGPALGMFQIEPDTHDDIWRNYLKYNEKRSAHILDMLAPMNRPDTTSWLGNVDWHRQLITNLDYSVVMARLVYYRQNFEWPAPDDVRALGNLWKVIYNTSHGAGSVEQFIDHFPAEILD